MNDGRQQTFVAVIINTEISCYNPCIEIVVLLMLLPAHTHSVILLKSFLRMAGFDATIKATTSIDHDVIEYILVK